jgi:hypothetical protein
MDQRGDRLVRGIAIYTALLATGLTVLIVVRSAGIGVFLAFVGPLFLASWIAVRYRGRLILVIAAVLVGVPGLLSLIGGIGLLMLPASILFFVAAFTVPTARIVPGSPA